MREAPKRPEVGQPTKFRDEYCNLIRVLRSEGHGISGFCSYVGIARKTYYNWKDQYPQFREACEVAEEDSDAHFTKTMLDGGTGKIKNFVPAAIREVYNRQHGVVKEESSNGKTEITVGTMNILQTLSDADLHARIAQKMASLSLIKVDDDKSTEDAAE